MFFSGQHFYPHTNYQIPNYLPLPYPNPTTVPQQMAAAHLHWPTYSMASQLPSTSSSTATAATTLKSSKSYGDILSEIKKEEAVTAAE